MKKQLTSLFHRRQVAAFAKLACTILFTTTLPTQGADFNTVPDKPFTTATGSPYWADPTGANDSTTAIQNCIDDARLHRGACVLPLATLPPAFCCPTERS